MHWWGKYDECMGPCCSRRQCVGDPVGTGRGLEGGRDECAEDPAAIFAQAPRLHAPPLRAASILYFPSLTYAPSILPPPSPLTCALPGACR